MWDSLSIVQCSCVFNLSTLKKQNVQTYYVVNATLNQYKSLLLTTCITVFLNCDFSVFIAIHKPYHISFFILIYEIFLVIAK